MMQSSTNPLNCKRPTRRAIPTGVGTIAAGAPIPLALMTERPAAEPIENDNGDWLGPCGVLDPAWSIIGSEPRRCPCATDPGARLVNERWERRGVDRLCRSTDHERGTLWPNFREARLHAAPNAADALGHERWVQRLEVRQPNAGTSPRTYQTGDLAALAPARAIEFAPGQRPSTFSTVVFSRDVAPRSCVIPDRARSGTRPRRLCQAYCRALSTLSRPATEEPRYFPVG